MNFQLNPEHRSITAICVVEDVSKCPIGYTPIFRTHDTDQDADLWKDGFFGRRVTRYVCVSKSQGRPEHVLHSLMILSDKESPPDGFSIVAQTADSSQKAFQKKQLCYKLAHYRSNMESIVEIVIFSKMKTSGGVYSSSPDGFDLLGDINGMFICVRKISALTRLNSPALGYGMSPFGANMGRTYADVQQQLKDLNMSQGGSSASPYGTPTSPPQSHSQPYSPTGMMSPYNSPQYPPQQQPQSPPLKHQNSNTLAQWSDIAGVPFVLHDELQSSQTTAMLNSSRFTPSIQIKSENDIAREYAYDFVTERNILITNGC